MPKKLDFQICSSLLSSLVSLGDKKYELTEQLIEKGFCAFKANLALLEQFASTHEELELHRIIEIEKAKEYFANPFAIMFELDSSTYCTPYKSSFLSKLKLENDPTGSLSLEVDPIGKDSWRLEIDPCLRAYKKLGWDEQTALRKKSEAEFHAFRNEEINHFIKPPHRRLQVRNEAEARNIGQEVLSSALRPFRFSLNDNLSSPKAIYLSKPLIDGWAITFAVTGDDWGFDSYSFEKINGVKVITPKRKNFHLDLRRADSKQKNLNNKNLSYLPLNIATISPLGEHAYFAYLDMDEMVVGLLGYAQLYALVADELEEKLKAGLH